MFEKKVREVSGGGAGGEAQVRKQFRNFFPGVGGKIIIQQPIMAAWREEFNQIQGMGKKLFLKHLILKKLDDYFTRTDRYLFPHISRPLGSVEVEGALLGGYWYQWVYGRESFPWEYSKADGGREAVALEEWGRFTACFESAGINLAKDVSDADNGLISQNIIHEDYRTFEIDLNFCWKRIDFGPGSMRVDSLALGSFLEANADSLISILGHDRFNLMTLAAVFLFSEEKMFYPDCQRLDRLTAIYRLSSLRQNTAEILMP